MQHEIPERIPNKEIYNTKYQSAFHTRKIYNTKYQSEFHTQKNITHIFFLKINNTHNTITTQTEDIKHKSTQYHNAFHTQKNKTQNYTIPE